MTVRAQHPDDHEAILHVYAEAFRRPRFRPPQDVGCVAPEVGLFEALCAAGDVIAELSFTALDDAGAIVGHVTASRATVATDAVVAVGPVGVVPEQQGAGIGSALMHALLSAADASGVPLVVLLGAPQFYGRFGFRPGRRAGRRLAGAGVGRCLPGPTVERGAGCSRGPVPIRAGLLGVDRGYGSPRPRRRRGHQPGTAAR